MRPGPGLVVMALAFISGARRGSTSSISSKTTTTSSSPPPPQPPIPTTTLTLTAPASSTSASTSSSFITSSTTSITTTSTPPQPPPLNIYDHFGFFGSSFYNNKAQPQLHDHPHLNKRRPKESPPPQPLTFFNSFYINNFRSASPTSSNINSYPSTSNYFTYTYPLPSHLTQHYDDPRARSESKTVSHPAKHTRRATKKFRRRRKRRTRSANVSYRGSGAGSDDVTENLNDSDDTLTSTAVESSSGASSSADSVLSDQTTLARGLPVHFPSLTDTGSSRSLDEDDIFALVAGDEFLSEESFDHLARLTNAKIGDTNEEDYSSGTETVIESSSGSGSGALEENVHDLKRHQQQQEEIQQLRHPQNAVEEDFIRVHEQSQQHQEQEESPLQHQKQNEDLQLRDDNGDKQKPETQDHESDQDQDNVDTIYTAHLLSNNNDKVVAIAGEDSTHSLNPEQQEQVLATTNTNQAELVDPDRYRYILQSKYSLTRLNPWISACDLAQPGPSVAPDLQGECSAGTLPVAWVDEGPGPPICLNSCKKETPFTNKLNKDIMLNNNSNNNNNKNDNKLVGYSRPPTTTRNTFNIKLRNSQPTISHSQNINYNNNKNNNNKDNTNNNKNNMKQKLLNPFNYYQIQNDYNNNKRNSNNKMAKTRRNLKENPLQAKTANIDHNNSDDDKILLRISNLTEKSDINHTQISPTQTSDDVVDEDYDEEEDLMQSMMMMQQDDNAAATNDNNLNNTDDDNDDVAAADDAAALTTTNIEEHQVNDAAIAAAIVMQLHQNQANNNIVKMKLTTANYDDNSNSNNHNNNNNNHYELKYNHMKHDHSNSNSKRYQSNSNNIDSQYHQQHHDFNSNSQRNNRGDHQIDSSTIAAAALSNKNAEYLQKSQQQQRQQQQQQQCLEYLGDSDETMPTHLCHHLTPTERLTQLRRLRLRNCCERNIYSALHTLALNATLSGGAQCLRILQDIMAVDAMASRITCGLTEILFRFDCRQVYSIVNQCDDCKEAYRRWVCSTLVPYFAEPSDVIKPPEIYTTTPKSGGNSPPPKSYRSPTSFSRNNKSNISSSSNNNNTTMASNMTTSHTNTAATTTHNNGTGMSSLSSSSSSSSSQLSSLSPLLSMSQKTATSNFITTNNNNNNNNKNDIQYVSNSHQQQQHIHVQLQQQQHHVKRRNVQEKQQQQQQLHTTNTNNQMHNNHKLINNNNNNDIHYNSELTHKRHQQPQMSQQQQQQHTPSSTLTTTTATTPTTPRTTSSSHHTPALIFDDIITATLINMDKNPKNLRSSSYHINLTTETATNEAAGHNYYPYKSSTNIKRRKRSDNNNATIYIDVANKMMPLPRGIQQQQQLHQHQTGKQPQQQSFNFISTANSKDPLYVKDPVISKLLKRSKRKVEFRKRRRIRPCLSVCQTVEQKCPYLLPADRAPALPTQYAGEPTFLCLDYNIAETEEQLQKASHGPNDCCYTYCTNSADGICTYCNDMWDKTEFDEEAELLNEDKETRVFNITMKAHGKQEGERTIRIETQIQQKIGEVKNNLKMTTVAISVRNETLMTNATRLAERLPYYAYCDGVFYYDDDVNDMPKMPSSEDCKELPTVQSRCTVPYYATNYISSADMLGSYRKHNEAQKLLIWLSTLLCLWSCYSARSMKIRRFDDDKTNDHHHQHQHHHHHHQQQQHHHLNHDNTTTAYYGYMCQSCQTHEIMPNEKRFEKVIKLWCDDNKEYKIIIIYRVIRMAPNAPTKTKLRSTKLRIKEKVMLLRNLKHIVRRSKIKLKLKLKFIQIPSLVLLINYKQILLLLFKKRQKQRKRKLDDKTMPNRRKLLRRVFGKRFKITRRRRIVWMNWDITPKRFSNFSLNNYYCSCRRIFSCSCNNKHNYDKRNMIKFKYNIIKTSMRMMTMVMITMMMMMRTRRMIMTIMRIISKQKQQQISIIKLKTTTRTKTTTHKSINYINKNNNNKYQLVLKSHYYYNYDCDNYIIIINYNNTNNNQKIFNSFSSISTTSHYYYNYYYNYYSNLNLKLIIIMIKMLIMLFTLKLLKLLLLLQLLQTTQIQMAQVQTTQIQFNRRSSGSGNNNNNHHLKLNNINPSLSKNNSYNSKKNNYRYFYYYNFNINDWWQRRWWRWSIWSWWYKLKYDHQDENVHHHHQSNYPRSLLLNKPTTRSQNKIRYNIL